MGDCGAPTLSAHPRARSSSGAALGHLLRDRAADAAGGPVRTRAFLASPPSRARPAAHRPRLAQQEAPRQEFTPLMQNLLLTVAGTARAGRVSLKEDRTSKR